MWEEAFVENVKHWQSTISSLLKNIYNFTTRYLNNTLPTLKNMSLWKKTTSSFCSACLNPQTLQHIVSSCNVHLEQGCFTWRHNSILKTLEESCIKKNYLIYADIEGFDNPSVIITFCIIVLLGYNFKTNFLISSCTTITQPRCLCKNSECWLSSHTDRLIF